MPRTTKPVQAKGSTEPKSTDAARSVKRAREEDDDGDAMSTYPDKLTLNSACRCRKSETGVRRGCRGRGCYSGAYTDPDMSHLNNSSFYVQAQMNELKAKLAKARSKRVKREPSPIRLTVSGDTIDLTSD